MINFKEHDGLLFKMLDKPVPLTKDAEMPCIIAPIQDDSPMGRYVKQCWGHDKLFMREYTICNINADMAAKVGVAKSTPLSIHMFEIIGTLVEEGSADWALYQMMQGEKICHHKSPSIVYCKHAGDIRRQVRYNCVDYMSASAWLNGADNTGWQIYEEPKPEPIFTTGDKVTDGVIDGTIIHIEDAIANVCPSTDEYKIELCNLNHISESPKQDDVEKPLRSMIAEAKAIGKNIRTYYQDIVFTPQALEACLNQGEFRWWNICNWELTTREQNYFPSISTSSDRPKEEPQHAKEPIANCENCKHVCTNSNVDHCHMYEPKLKSENIIHGYIPADMHLKYIHLFKVGDWVECKDLAGVPAQCKVLEIRKHNVILECTTGHIWSLPHNNIICKLSPSEIIVTIGCLSGTIAKSCDPNYFLMLHSRPATDCNHSMIRFSAIDTETRSLVESLLKAQKEEE